MAPLAPGRGEGTGVRGDTTLFLLPHGYFADSWSHAKPRSREAAKRGTRVIGPWAVFEYEYRPPGRTEYEYEVSFFGGGQSVFGGRVVDGGAAGAGCMWAAVTGGVAAGEDGSVDRSRVVCGFPQFGWRAAVLGSVAPSPPTPLPRFTGARGGLCVFCRETAQ